MSLRKFRSEKLWRDKDIVNVEKDGSIVHWNTLDDASFDEHLRRKCLEEVHEVIAAASQKELMSEVADLYEVLNALCALHGISEHDILAMQKAKYAKRGGFERRCCVHYCEHPAGSEGERYCLNAPDKYPEVFDND